MKLARFIVLYFVFTFCQLLVKGNLCAQTTLESVYQKMSEDLKEGDDCDQAFFTLAKRYFFEQEINGKNYHFIIQDRLNNKVNVMKIKEIEDLQKYPLLFLSTYIHYLYRNYETLSDYKSRTVTWKNVKEIVKVMQDLVPDTKTVKDKESGFLLNRIMKKNKKLRNSNCLPPLIRNLAKLAMEEASIIIENLIEELKNDSTKLVTLKDEVVKNLDKMDTQKRILNSLKLDKPKELLAKLGDSTLFLFGDAVGLKETIDITSFAVGQYCDNSIKTQAQKYAYRNLRKIHSVMDVRDSLLKIYTEMNKIIKDAKEKKIFDMPYLGGVEAYQGIIEIEATITGKADGSGGCYQENWANCSSINYKYNGEWNDINEIIAYSFDKGDKIKDNFQIRSVSSSSNSDKLYIMKANSNLNNLSLAFLRGYCVGRTIEDIMKNDAQNKNRYVYKSKYKAYQYKTFYTASDRAFEIETDFINAKKAIGDYMLKIANDMKTLRSHAQNIQEKIDDLTEALRILRS